MKKRGYRTYDAAEIPPLLEKAKAGDLDARDRLLMMFESLITTLVGACMGKVNPRSSYCRTFLKMFTRGDQALGSASIYEVANLLKSQLSNPNSPNWMPAEELRNAGRLAVLSAIEKCRENLASTIVIQFQEVIMDVLKSKNSFEVRMTEYENLDPKDEDPETRILFEMFMASLDEEEWAAAAKIIDGEDPGEIPESLRTKFSGYVEKDLPYWEAGVEKE